MTILAVTRPLASGSFQTRNSVMILFFLRPFGMGSTSMAGLPFSSRNSLIILPRLFFHLP